MTIRTEQNSNYHHFTEEEKFDWRSLLRDKKICLLFLFLTYQTRKVKWRYLTLTTNILEKWNLRYRQVYFKLKWQRDRTPSRSIWLIFIVILYRTVGYRYAGFMGQKPGWHRVKWKMTLRWMCFSNRNFQWRRIAKKIKKIRQKREREREKKSLHKYHFIISSQIFL